VLTIAKRDLKAGERLDGVGAFCSYGLIDNRAAARAVGALPIGLSEECVLRRDVAKDEVISFDDVESPRGRLAEKLWREQNERWPLERLSRPQAGQALLGSERSLDFRSRLDATLPRLTQTLT
jgi:predicted homoserine dehydrogenase-like protein